MTGAAVTFGKNWAALSIALAACARGGVGVDTSPEAEAGVPGSTDAAPDMSAPPTPVVDSGAHDAPGETRVDASAPDEGAPVATDASSPSEPPGIQYFGRWDLSDPTHATASWGAVYLKARFEGTSVGIVLDDANAFAVGNDYEWSVDGSALAILSPGASGTYPLASGLADGVHTLEMYRRTEGSYGETVVGGLVLDPGKSVLTPPPRPPHRIEFVGDSISAGFGDESQGGSDRHTQNGYMAFGPQLARLLDAEWSVIAHSGRGLYRNLGEQPPLVQPHMPDEFKLAQFLTSNTLPSSGASGAFWSFDSWKADAVVIALGTNDFAQPGPFPAEADFIAATSRFLGFLRGVYPATTVFLVGTFVPENGLFGTEWQTANAILCDAVAAANAAGDPRVHCIDPCGQSAAGWLPDASDYIGDWTHPTVAGHTIIASHLHDAIAPIMGW
jgi:lysophospholipase L1-like esterase